MGANNGFVRIWYDQSGNGNNAANGTAAAQPSIVTSGIVNRTSGLGQPVVTTTTNSQSLNFAVSPGVSGSNLTANAVAYMQNTTGNNARLVSFSNGSSSDDWNNNNYVGAIIGNSTANQVRADRDFFATSTSKGLASFSSNTPGLITSLFNGTNHQMFVNGSGGTAVASSGAFGITFGRLFNHANDAGPAVWAGGAWEIIVFPSALSTTDRQTLENNQLNTYNINNANLSALSLSNGVLNTSFAANTTAYTATVSNNISSITVTPTLEISGDSLKVRVNGGSYTTVTSGTASAALSLNIGSNTVDVRVTALDGTTLKTYTVTVTRNVLALDNAGLSASNPSPAAFSLRKLSTTYTGNAIQVRRSNDNVTSEIGFTAGGNLDTAALKTFVGANNGFVTIWYDQSGNGRNAIQATNGSQPQIVSSGSVIRKNGNPTISFNGQKLATAGFTGYQNALSFTLAIVAGVSSDIGSQSFGGKTLNNYAQSWDIWGSNFFVGDGGWGSGGPVTLTKGLNSTTGFAQWSFTGNPSTRAAYINGTGNGSGAVAYYGDGGAPLILGSRADGGTQLNGWISEYVTLGSVLNTTDRQTVENNQLAFYNFTNTNLSNVSLSIGTISPSFAANTTAYTGSVANATSSITVTPTVEISGATIQVRVNGGSYATVASGAASSALSLNVGSNTIDVRVTALDGTTTKTYTITVTRNTLPTWTGATSNVWNLASNWSPAEIPASNANVVIGNSNNDPVLGSNTIVNDLTLNDTLVIGNTTLTINGAVSGSSVLRGASNSNLTITGTSGTIRFDQNSLGNTNVLRNLTISGSGTTVLGNTLNITGGSSSGIVTVGSGATLNTGGNLVLKSNATGTASIGSSVGTISGNVTVERFIPRRRAFRFLSSPVNTSNFISNNWQQATHITGSLTGQNGFDQSNSGTASLFTYNAGTEAWVAIPNTNATNLNIGTGYRMLIRGDRNINLNTTTPQDSAMLVLSATGSIVMGNVVFGGGSVSSSPAGIPALNAAVGSGSNNSTIGWSLIGNPYASAVNWTQVTKSNVSNTFATWNVNNAGRGSYVYHNGSAGTGFGASNIINSGQAVFVQTIGANPSITFTEASKVSSAPPSHFKKSLSDVLNIDIFIGDRAYDALTVLFDEKNNNEYDVNDFIKLVNPEINFYSYLADGTKLAMNNMKEVGEETIVPLGLNGVFNGGSYELKFSNQNTFANAEVKLKDKFINKLYDLKSINNLVFTVTADSNSFGENRFELIFSKSATGLNNELSSSNNNFIVFPNPANNVLNLSLTTTREDNYNFAIYNQLGAEISNGNLDFNAKRTHVLNIENLSAGVYFIQVKNGKSSQTIKFIK